VARVSALGRSHDVEAEFIAWPRAQERGYHFRSGPLDVTTFHCDDGVAHGQSCQMTLTSGSYDLDPHRALTADRHAQSTHAVPQYNLCKTINQFSQIVR